MVFKGDVYYADLNPVIGSEQGGVRPVVILQNDIGNKYSPTTIVAPMTTKSKTYVVNRERKGVKKASLEFIKLATAEIENGTVSLVKIKLHTGRTHQIRVQFASRKHPILGDRKYGSSAKCQVALFSHKISFNLNGQNYEFKALPDSIYPWSLFDKVLSEI